MNRVFVDTSAFVAFMDKRDPRHKEALTAFGALQKRNIELVTTDFILDETITMVLSRAGHQKAVEVGEHILTSKALMLIWLDTAIKIKAWEYFKRHKDKNYSFTDCTSFVVMKEMKIKHYIAFDEHFRQAGFVRFR
jgi:predicted nucleic acid-binding protein